MRISIITIAKNPGRSVNRTIQSIQECIYPNIQWIYIDGASTDNSLELVKSCCRIPDIFISESDQGIADAFNKGLSYADGEAIIYLNAGDAFATPDTLSKLVSSWRRDQYRWITGGEEVRREDETLLYTRTPLGKKFAELIMWGCYIRHSSTLCETSLLREFHGFDNFFRISMDYDLWLRLYNKQVYPQITSLIVSKFYVGGASSKIIRRYYEDKYARKKNNLQLPWLLEKRLCLIAYFKSIAPRSIWMYRVKEWLRW